MKHNKPRPLTGRQNYLIWYIRHKLKRKYNLSISWREIDITPFTSFQEIPVPDRYYIRELSKTGFSIQLTIFNQKQIIKSDEITWEQ